MRAQDAHRLVPDEGVTLYPPQPWPWPDARVFYQSQTSKVVMKSRGQAVRERELRITRDRFLEQLQRFPRHSPADRLLRSSETNRVRANKGRTRPDARSDESACSLFRGVKDSPVTPSRFFREFALQSEKVCRFAIECIGPDMVVGSRVDQLRIDAHAISRSSHRAFENVCDTEGSADLAQMARACAVLPTDVRLMTLRSATLAGSTNVVLYAVGKVSVLLVVAQIFEGQNRNAFFRHI